MTGLTSGISLLTGSIDALLWKASGLFVVFGLVDLLRQKARYERDLKMSKQELRDEAKELEGNPAVAETLLLRGTLQAMKAIRRRKFQIAFNQHSGPRSAILTAASGAPSQRPMV